MENIKHRWKKITQIFGRCENVLLFCVQMY